MKGTLEKGNSNVFPEVRLNVWCLCFNVCLCVAYLDGLRTEIHIWERQYQCFPSMTYNCVLSISYHPYICSILGGQNAHLRKAVLIHFQKYDLPYVLWRVKLCWDMIHLTFLICSLFSYILYQKLITIPHCVRKVKVSGMGVYNHWTGLDYWTPSNNESSAL